MNDNSLNYLKKKKKQFLSILVPVYLVYQCVPPMGTTNPLFSTFENGSSNISPTTDISFLRKLKIEKKKEKKLIFIYF